MTNCNRSGGPTPAVTDPCALLPQLRAAFYQLMAGQARAVVRNGDQWLEYQKGDAKTLQHEVRRLEAICGGRIGAVRAR